MESMPSVAAAEPRQAAAAAVTIPAHLFRAGFDAVRAFRTSDGSRPILESVLVDPRPDGLGLIATDSHTLADVTVPYTGADDAGEDAEPAEWSPPFDPVMIAGDTVGHVWDAVKGCKPFRGSPDWQPAVTITPDQAADAVTVTVDDVANGRTIAGRLCIGDFPKWQAVIPESSSYWQAWRDESAGPAFVAFSPTYMTRVCKAAAVLAKAGRADAPVRWTFTSALQPAVATVVAGDLAARFLIMPVRVKS